MKKIIKISCMLFSIAFIITFIPVKTCAKVTNPFASQTQERPFLAPESGKYLRIIAAEISCDDKSLKQLYRYYIKNRNKFEYVVIDFGTGNGLFCNKKNKTFIYGKLQKNNKTNSYKISKKKGTIKIKGKSVIRKTGNRLPD